MRPAAAPRPSARSPAAAAGIAPPKEVALKDAKDWKLLGKPTRRLEIGDKVQGKPLYGIDVRLPGMLYAALIQCAGVQGHAESVDDSKLAGMQGVRKVVKFKDAVAVVADSWWQAKKAADALAIDWDDGGYGKVSSDSITDFLRTGLAAADAGIGRKDGDVAAGLAKAARRMEAEYYVPFLAHATLEPQNCTAHVVGDKVEIWVSTQNGEAALAAAAKAAGVPPRNVMVHKTHARRRLRPARRRAGLHPACGADRQGDGRAGEDDLVARRGHAPRLLPAGRHGAGWRRDSTPTACRSPGMCA